MKLCKHCKKYNICDRGKHLYGSNSTYAEICKDFQQKRLNNFEHIKMMSLNELAQEHIYFIPDNDEVHYTGLSGKYRKTSEEVVKDNIEWLKSEVANDE